ncbi:MAG TPA: hypothetical protein VHA09_06215 [Nitrososphaera sp.]|nr:hypothetical protein [Nitrososphaera sp.]
MSSYNQTTFVGKRRNLKPVQTKSVVIIAAMAAVVVVTAAAITTATNPTAGSAYSSNGNSNVMGGASGGSNYKNKNNDQASAAALMMAAAAGGERDSPSFKFFVVARKMIFFACTKNCERPSQLLIDELAPETESSHIRIHTSRNQLFVRTYTYTHATS